jgi:hypothetical protein
MLVSGCKQSQALLVVQRACCSIRQLSTTQSGTGKADPDEAGVTDKVGPIIS